MKRLILVDGNNLLFRSYFATAYTGNVMKNSKGFPTNALYGFVSMMNSIIEKEKPEYMLVAFDKGKSFRHKEYKDYKAGRASTPQELIDQIPYSREILTYMGIKHFEIDDYEADDIIGTCVKKALEDKDFDSRIISSDRDLLQLMNEETDMKLLKQKDFIIYNPKTYKEEFGIDPIKVIDLKALEGDKSDNIPGVRGIGEKTALSLLQKYDSLEGVYEHLSELKGATLNKLEEDKEMAFFSKKLATIYCDVDLPFTLEDCKLVEEDTLKLNNLFEELEFYSFLKKRKTISNKTDETLNYKIITDKFNLENDASYYIELDNLNYHKGNIIGVGIYDGKCGYYLDKEALLKNKDIMSKLKYTYDYKKNIVALNKIGINIKSEYDLMISSYLLETNLREDITYLMNQSGIDVMFSEQIVKSKELDNDKLINDIILKAKYIYDTKDSNINLLKEEELFDLYNEIEFPLVSVLADMEITGIEVSLEDLKETEEELRIKKDMVTTKIYNQAGHEFNIASPKQLGVVLFEELGIPYPGKKGGKNGYSTSHETLVKLQKTSSIIDDILEYRNYTKLLNTYVETLPSFVLEDGKIHTMYKQTITRTGRLSSADPNLQNIPVRSEIGKELRKVFASSNGNYILSSDYSQIELRVLAHITEDENLVNSFVNGEDIHSRVAADIYGINIEDVTKDMRRTAKAVIFGIVYGISGFGLSENLGISAKEGKELIEKYLTLYPKVREYMTNIIIEAKKDNSVRTLFGRKRTIEELANQNFNVRQSGERMALNTPIQGTSADIIKKAMIDVFNELKNRNLKSKMILQIHDELVFDVYKDEIDEVIKIVKDKMENVYSLKVPLKVEIEYGLNLYEAK